MGRIIQDLMFRLPFIAYQFHPEKNLFEWKVDYPVAHDFYGAAASQYFGDYFIQQTRKSCQKFESQEDLEPYLIYNYNQVYSQYMFDNFHFTQMYIFDNQWYSGETKSDSIDKKQTITW